MSSRLFAAYGFGLNRAEMAKHCPTAKLIGSAELKNYRLSFRGSKASAVGDDRESEERQRCGVAVGDFTAG